MSTTHPCNQSGVRRGGATRVLVVDDYRGAAIATATYLSLDGMEARVVGGCGDALEAVKNCTGRWRPTPSGIDPLRVAWARHPIPIAAIFD
ncbi:hypothetical protein CA601_09680 [Paraburkholderia hospita]|nr:hypothetical protein CA601_09680 [Paraburkholderia hospita]